MYKRQDRLMADALASSAVGTVAGDAACAAADRPRTERLSAMASVRIMTGTPRADTRVSASPRNMSLLGPWTPKLFELSDAC